MTSHDVGKDGDPTVSAMAVLLSGDSGDVAVFFVEGLPLLLAFLILLPVAFPHELLWLYDLVDP